MLYLLAKSACRYRVGYPARAMRVTSCTPQHRSWCSTRPASHCAGICFSLGLMQRTKCSSVLQVHSAACHCQPPWGITGSRDARHLPNTGTEDPISPSHTTPQRKRPRTSDTDGGSPGAVDATPALAKRRKIGTPKSATTLQDLLQTSPNDDVDMQQPKKTKLKRVTIGAFQDQRGSRSLRIVAIDVSGM